MAIKIVEYKFSNYDRWFTTQNHLSNEFSSSCYETFTSCGYYYISIWDNCDEPKTAGRICEVNGGDSC